MADDPLHANEGHDMDVDILGETDAAPGAADRYAWHSIVINNAFC